MSDSDSSRGGLTSLFAIRILWSRFRCIPVESVSRVQVITSARHAQSRLAPRSIEIDVAALVVVVVIVDVVAIVVVCCCCWSQCL